MLRKTVTRKAHKTKAPEHFIKISYLVQQWEHSFAKRFEMMMIKETIHTAKTRFQMGPHTMFHDASPQVFSIGYEMSIQILERFIAGNEREW